jgi:hypothetical protein
MTYFYTAVEGMIDEAVVKRLLDLVNGRLVTTFGKNGKDRILRQMQNYNNAARYSPWVILIDLDDTECAPMLSDEYLPVPSPYMCFNVAVRETESWLMADRERISHFLSVAVSRIPKDCESLENPKEKLVEIAGHSRRREIREDMVPRVDSGVRIGPAYNSRLVEFASDVEKGWRPQVAAESSASLNRCIRHLKELVKTFSRNKS